MAIEHTRITIVGCGPGSPAYLTDAARQAVAHTEILVGSQRLIELFPNAPAERILVDAHIASLLDRMALLHAAGRRLAVLVSGDPGLCSLARNVVGRFGREGCEVIPAVSSVQVAFARLGLDWTDTRIVSAHGRTPEASSGELRRSDKIAVLIGTQEALRWSARIALDLAGSHTLFLAENLTLADERFRQVSAEQLGNMEAASLSMILLIRNSVLA